LVNFFGDQFHPPKAKDFFTEPFPTTVQGWHAIAIPSDSEKMADEP
jgi:hypothetical protein